jgi:cold shock CspA family protein
MHMLQSGVDICTSLYINSRAGRFGFVTTAAGADVFVHISQMCFEHSLRCAGTAVLFQARHSIVSIAVVEHT